MSLLVATLAITGAAVAWQAVQSPASLSSGPPMVAAFATALSGVAAALLTMRTRWSRPTAYASFAVAAALAALGLDRAAMTLRGALTETTARATPVSETDLGAAGNGLRVSPSGTHFLVSRTPMGYRPTVRPRLSLLAGRVGGSVRDVQAIAGEFVDDDRMLVIDPLEHGVELRLERVDSATTPLWVDTLPDVSVGYERLLIDRDARSWAVVATDEDNDRSAVFSGRIGEKGVTRRAVIPDTLTMMGEPIVFGQGTTVIVPTLNNALREGRPVSLWTLPFTGFDALRTDLWRVRGDSIQRVSSLRGAPQCGDPVVSSAACVVRQMKATSLYTVSETGVATEVARLQAQDIGIVAVGPGLRTASMGFDRTVLVTDLAARRLTRIPLPPNSTFASEVRAGPGYIVTLSIDQNRRSTVRLYRVDDDK